MIEIFLIKLLDTVLVTAKSIEINKGRMFSGALLSAVAQLIFFKITKQVINNDSDLYLYIVCLATFIGVYIAMIFTKKLQGENTYYIEITPMNVTKEEAKAFADLLRAQGFAMKTYKGYIKKGEPILCCKIYSDCKEETQRVLKMVPKGFVYHIVSTKKVHGLENFFE